MTFFFCWFVRSFVGVTIVHVRCVRFIDEKVTVTNLFRNIFGLIVGGVDGSRWHIFLLNRKLSGFCRSLPCDCSFVVCICEVEMKGTLTTLAKCAKPPAHTSTSSVWHMIAFRYFSYTVLYNILLHFSAANLNNFDKNRNAKSHELLCDVCVWLHGCTYLLCMTALARARARSLCGAPYLLLVDFRNRIGQQTAPPTTTTITEKKEAQL